MERVRSLWHRISLGLIVLSAFAGTGCQTVKTPEEEIASSSIPREKNMTSMPAYVVEPPDLLVVEVLESLPGRPISGERLVRPDGTITLGFYGDVYVTGLSLPEVKEKIVLHLRKYLSDEVLGLWKLDDKGNYVPVDPKDSDTVYVDIGSYNSKFYYVHGDVSLTGRFPITGNETVLDALNNAGGLIPTAAPRNIRLVRPAPPGGCCEQKFPVNLAAIISGGDPTTNYQLMPGDRLVVYRDPIVRATIFIDRLAAPFQTVINSGLQYTFFARQIQFLRVGVTTGTGAASGTSTANPTAVVQPGAR
ncbi:MAG: polysaccharide biosynthesis/export family protein [Isosphaeraceae bacterium]|nr:polysaccharide biosynthesis/export family protein [Isosphaeraceae bacterium]